MKIITFEALPTSEKIGVVTEWKKYIDSDYLKIETDKAGSVKIGPDTYQANDCEAYVPQSKILLGESYKIMFIDADGQAFNCGSIRRTGSHMLEIRNDLEACIIACHVAIESQCKKISDLSDEIDKIKKELSISVI